MKQSRWKCPTCDHGLLAPTRPRRNDIRRYCLPCSSKAGVLVERVAPALDAQRAARDAARRERERKTRERQRARNERALNAPREVARRKYSKEGQYGMPIERETARLWKMLAKIPTTLEGSTRAISRVTHNSPPTVTLFKKGWQVDEQHQVWRSGRLLGRAHQSGHIQVAPNVSWETLAHEIIHCAGYRGHDRAFYYALKWITERRFGIIVNYSQATRYGYVVDSIIEEQIDDIVRSTFQKPTEPEPE